MRRPRLVSKLLGELYAATAYDNPVPMDPRRIKRLLYLDGECGETLNRAAAAIGRRNYHRPRS